jgi:hypothetical protein
MAEHNFGKVEIWFRLPLKAPNKKEIYAENKIDNSGRCYIVVF